MIRVEAGPEREFFRLPTTAREVAGRESRNRARSMGPPRALGREADIADIHYRCWGAVLPRDQDHAESASNLKCSVSRVG